jgi:riboflavin synthase
MFTGLIEAIGRIEALAIGPAGGRLRVATPLGRELQPGESVAVNGVCLTVIARDAQGFEADLSPATLAATTLARPAGQLVNLERPLRADSRIGGHFVLGHVDGIGRVVSVGRDGECRWITIGAPAELAPLLVPKGSVAVDGISLTVATLEGSQFAVQIVPFTLEHTALHAVQPGDAVNLEADVLGKYVARLLGASREDGAAWPLAFHTTLTTPS